MANPTYPIGLQQRLNQIANKYASITKSRVQEELDQFAATGKLSNSVKIRVIPATGESSPDIQLEYAPYGEFIGKRKLLFAKQPDVGNLEEHLSAKGFKAKSIPGYKGEAPNLTEEQKTKRVAFAIARDKKLNDTHKRKPWKKKSLPDVLRSLNVEIRKAYVMEIEQEIAKSLTTT